MGYIYSEMNHNKIREAIFDGQIYTADEWGEKKELQNRSKKKDEPNLECPIGCRLTYVRECDVFYKKNKLHGKRCACFRHVNTGKRDCLYIEKYKGGGGESEEHLHAKHLIASGNVAFKRVCKMPGCNETVVVAPYPCWASKVEVKLNKWLFDVVYFEGDQIKVVIEVKHTHGTDGEKRKWAMAQDFEYLEVPTNQDKNNTVFTVIDMHGMFKCPKIHCEICNDLFSFDDSDCLCTYRTVSRDDWLTDGFDSMTEDQRDKWNKLLIKRGVRPPTPAATVKPVVEQTRQENSTINVAGLFSYRIGGLPITEFHIEERADRKKLQQLWRESDLNKQLLLGQPEYKYPTGNMSGCHLLIVMFAYPWSICWLLGYDPNAIRGVRKNFIDKHQHIYNKAVQLAKARVPRHHLSNYGDNRRKLYRGHEDYTFENYKDILAFIKSPHWGL